MKHLKRLFILIIFIAVFILVINVIPWAPTRAKNNEAWLRDKNQMPLIIPHGGAKEMYPENTMYAFDKTSHYDAFEIDLALTSDDILITHHDLHLGVMAGRDDLLVRDYTYSEVVQIIKDLGFPHVRNFNGTVKKENYSDWTDEEIIEAGLVPVSLEQVFQKYPDKLYILELKNTVRKSDNQEEVDNMIKDSEIAVKELANLIDKYHMHNKVLMASFDDSLVKNFNKLTKDRVGTMAGSISSAIFALTSYFKVDFFYMSSFEALSLPYNQKMGSGNIATMKKFPGFIQNILSDKVGDDYYFNMQRYEFQRDAQRKNIAVIYWTVNSKEDMIDLVKRGADGIITDDPELLEEVINLFK